MSERYEGFCSGGPYDGQFAWDENKECKVAVRFDPPLSDPEPMIRYGTYRHNLGRWIWSDDNAIDPR